MNEIKYSHIAVLGRNTELSIAELEALLGKTNVEKISNDLAYINTEDAPTLMKRLGGTIKISSIDAIGNNSQKVPEVMLHLLRSIEHSSKLIYGISTYPISKENENFLNFLLKNLKQLLKSTEIKSRYLNKGPKNIHTALILDSKVLKKGAELNVFKVGNEYIVGKTEAVQNINSYSFRDFKRPARDAKSGMLPPKFAQTLINLAYPYIKEEAVIYDPFCGSGTVLQEARLMNYEVIGSDNNPKAVRDSKTNMEWLDKKFFKSRPGAGSPPKTAQTSHLSSKTYKLFKHDITIPTEEFKKTDAIVCEGYLGPPIFKISEDYTHKIHAELTILYTKMFQTLGKTIQKGTAFIIALPFHVVKNKELFLRAIPNLIKSNGFKQERTSIKYRRSNQFVGREIFILTKN